MREEGEGERGREVEYKGPREGGRQEEKGGREG